MSRILGKGNFKLEFSYNGSINSISYKNEEKADILSKSVGFYLNNGYHKINFTEINYKNGVLSCKNLSKTQIVEFFALEYEDYIFFELKKTVGVKNFSNYTLNFEVKGAGLRLFELDYMTETKTADNVSTISFPYLYNECQEDPLGKFALYFAENEEAEDDILLTIWTNHNISHPKFNFPWTKENAKKIIEQFLLDYADRSQMMIKANSNAELYEFTSYLEQLGAKQVYLFTDTWRKDDFWPMNDTNWGLNEKVFPDGIQDLRKYSDYLSDRGMKLILHYVSGGIGFFDPLYMGEKPDKRLASWGKLSLISNLNCEKNEFSANIFSDIPYIVDFKQDGVRMPGMREFFSWNYLLIDNEIVKFDEMITNDDETVSFVNCTRGLFNTVRAEHKENTEIIGLIAPYNVNFIPSNDSDMLDEVAFGYANLINEGNIAHTEYDGAEIHCYNPWGYRKFADKVYKNLDRLVTAHDSSASAPRSYFHMRLNSVKKMVAGDCAFGHINHQASIKPYAHSRKASNSFEAHFNMSLGNIGTALGVALPEPMFGESLADLRAHGDCENIIRVVRNWKSVCKKMPANVHKFIDDSFKKPQNLWSKYNAHLTSDFVSIASQDGNKCKITPTFVMRRPIGDIKWQMGQEHGCLSPRQFIRKEQNLTLINDVDTQTPDAIIEILWSQEENAKTVKPHELESEKTVAFSEYDFFEDNNKGDDSHDEDIRPNIDITPNFNEIMNDTDMKISEIKSGGINIKAKNPEEICFLDAEYGATFKASCSLKNHRGMAIKLVGDGSGSILVINFARRDYIVKIDFYGEKTVVIPHGEVSWYDGNWGFRMKTKCTDYGFFEDAYISIGYIPPKTEVDIDILSIKCLREEPVSFTELSLDLNANRSILYSKTRFESGDIVKITDGKAVLLDKSWRKKEELECDFNNFVANKGQNDFIIYDNSNGNAFFEVQLIVKDTPIEF